MEIIKIIALGFGGGIIGAFGYFLFLVIRSSVIRRIRQRKFDSYMKSKENKYKNLSK